MDFEKNPYSNHLNSMIMDLEKNPHRNYYDKWLPQKMNLEKDPDNYPKNKLLFIL